MTTDTASVFAVNCRDLLLAGKVHRYTDVQLRASRLAGCVLLLCFARAPCFVSAPAV